MESELVFCFFLFFLVRVLKKVKMVSAAPNFRKVTVRRKLEMYVFMDNIYLKNGKHGQVGKTIWKSYQNGFYIRIFQTTYFKCRGQGGNKCPATGKILDGDEDTFVPTGGRHNHLGTDSDKIKIFDTKDKLMQAISQPVTSKKAAYLDCLASLPEDQRINFGSYKSMKSTLKRRASGKYPKCGSLRELCRQLTDHPVVSQELGKLDGKNFFRRYIRVDRRSKAALFLNEDAVQASSIYDTILVDGTFRTRPAFCAQILIIFRLVNGAVSRKT